MRLGVVPRKMFNLCPEACSNFGLISAQTLAIAPPPKTLRSAAWSAPPPVIQATQNRMRPIPRREGSFWVPSLITFHIDIDPPIALFRFLAVHVASPLETYSS